MKSYTFRVGGVLILLALFSMAAEASPIQTGDAFNMAFSGETCTLCWGNQVLPSVTIEGLLTVVPVTGATFWDPWYTDYVWHSGLMVTGISGTLDIDCLAIAGCFGDGSYSMSFLQAPLGDGSYLLSGSIPRFVVFSADGSGLDTRLINDNAYNLLQWSSPATGFGNQVPINWSAVQVPEPSSLSVLAVGLLGVTFLKSRHRKRSRTRGAARTRTAPH
jgi:hypothetical protein